MSQQLPLVEAASVVSVPLDVRIRRLGDVLLVARRGRTVELSETAAFIWQQVDGRRSIADISALLAAAYDIDADTALADSSETIADLLARRLLTLIATR